ncbi:hypothetical protein [Actinocrinis sp.]|uniref:hypothetical protein n=1 Tax=Actinocrinis sp. TaxID=1920516 RepID=UPI002D5B3C8B|nr:hypothetical protein [Actinocrinis sp.]HZP55045.1 hypothetical protein [Actinocrinis sp.]
MTALDVREVYVPITKKDRDPQTGHLYVYGKITGPDLDNDQQRMDPAWLKTAVPDWFKRGNIREQHDAKRAIGKAIELEEKADGWYIGAKIVDKDAIDKVEEEVLNGFSIGIRNWRLDHTKADAPAGTVVAGRIFETSVVDAPCLGSATINDHWRLPLAKADGAGNLQLLDEPALIRAESATFGLPAELFDRLAAPVKQALADLASAGAEVSAAAEQDAPAAKADTALAPVVVNVTVSGSVMGEQALTDAVREAAAAYKADTYASLDKAYTAEQKRQALAAGQAMPNAKGEPSYVIKTKADLRRAIKAVGRGNADHDDVRKHILTRAKALGLESMVPDNWNADGSLKDATKADAATVEKAEALLRDVRALVPELAKADDGDDGEDDGEDETADIAGAQEAIAAIAKLIVSEAESLAMGNLNEACDIALLLDAVRALKWFQANERAEQSGDTDTVMMLADAPAGDSDLLKADGKNGGNLAPPFKKKPNSGEDAADREDDGEGDADSEGGEKKKTATKADSDEHLLTKAEAADLVKAAVAAALTEPGDTPSTAADTPQTVTKTELAHMVKSAVAEARAADEERIAALTADLTKAQGDLDAIKALPVPGGPVLTRTAAQQESAMKSDSEALHAQAAALLAKADAYSANRDLAEGYRQRAKALLAKAAA